MKNLSNGKTLRAIFDAGIGYGKRQNESDFLTAKKGIDEILDRFDRYEQTLKQIAEMANKILEGK